MHAGNFPIIIIKSIKNIAYFPFIDMRISFIIMQVISMV